ncbi:MAG: hypothetical protein HY094_08975 [Candidatus Melainabacteria bacterium]|nr:hypothetical protein [Candidatus Melainabacteria bacterium]
MALTLQRIVLAGNKSHPSVTSIEPTGNAEKAYKVFEDNGYSIAALLAPYGDSGPITGIRLENMAVSYDSLQLIQTELKKLGYEIATIEHSPTLDIYLSTKRKLS